MLTFRFTGAGGEMIEEEMLTAGMEGKQVRLEFSEEWAGLRKAVVFAVGSRACTIVDAEEVEVIPAKILSESLRRLYVGAYGLTEEGMVVIPAMYATGPFIHIGTDTSGDDSAYDPEDPFWLELEQAVEKTLRFVPQELSEAEKLQSRKNIDALSGSPRVLELLTTVLKNGLYISDQQENILQLTAALSGKAIYNVLAQLEQVHMACDSRIVPEGDSFRAVLTAEEGYGLDSVTVRMGGTNITASVYSDGIVDIPAVTGEVEILAVALEEGQLRLDMVAKGNVTFTEGMGLQVNATTAWRAMLVPVGQYLKVGKTYRFSLGQIASTYAYGVQILRVSGPGMTFPYVADSSIYYNSVTARVVDSGWLQTDLDHTVQEENLVVAVNFKRMDGNQLGNSDFELLENNFVMEVEK
jgi:hypothetical protein